MHYSLSPRLNVGVIALMLALALLCIVAVGLPPLPLLVAFAAGGALAGHFLSHAHREQAERIRSARSAGEIRALLAATPAGKRANVIVVVQMLAFFLLLFFAKAYAPAPMLVAVIACFSAARKAATHPALLALSRRG
ncbi:hypothetical protein ACHMW6_05355 [Pseudoduganella sp. UC29_106]|uniref:hypothetical protein n=1 Tax=Pseudoduganella sp. UC29_106 TaxID=3374553 RepID=UPI0037567C96